jgi:hypothetical protein
VLNVFLQGLVGGVVHVVLYQVPEFGTALHIHKHRLPQFIGPKTRNLRHGIALTNGRNQTHMDRRKSKQIVIVVET